MTVEASHSPDLYPPFVDPRACDVLCGRGRFGPAFVASRSTATVPVLTCSLPVQVMGLWQLWLISLGESAVESHDNDYYRKTAKSLGRTFRNPYNLGRKANLTEFFNVGEGG